MTRRATIGLNNYERVQLHVAMRK